MSEPDGEAEDERIALFIDITEQATIWEKTSDYAGELERSNAELEQFAYVASHDLKEPIRSVSGFLNLALRQGRADIDPLVMDCIVQARDAAARMNTLVTDLLAYARVGRQRRESREVDVNDLMRLVLRDLRGAIDYAGAQVSWNDLPTLTADPTQLLQVIENLVNNAVKFHPTEHTPKVHIGAGRVAGGWRFDIKDNGIGIAVENQRRIFQIFQRLHTREEFIGTGIGLALCRRIVEGWGGQIGVESTLGQGATFWFTVPTHDTSPTQPLRKGRLHT
jgi:light-regulated signal transduction histidine kinase (bacteriophytochrome)